MSNEAPERIYIHPTSAEYHLNPWPLEPGEYVEYVRADLLATVRKEEKEAAFKEALSILNEFGRELRKADFLARLEAAAGMSELAELDRVLAEARVEDPIGVRLTELELERLDRLEASANSEKQVNEDDLRCYNKGGAL